MKNQAFGQVLSEGIRSVKARQNRKIQDIEADIALALGYEASTVQRWRKGYVPANEQHVEFLARYIVKNGHGGRHWVDRFLLHARYYDRQKLLDELCPERLGLLGMDDEQPAQNLPPRYGDFLGRQEEMIQIIEGLTSRWPLISIEGMGGIGKTTLAIEVARACLPSGSAKLDEPFSACVFISAKDRTIMLNDLLDTIARVLNYPYITQQTAPKDKPREVNRLLRARPVLLIVDNFETVTDRALLEYLQRIPEPSKALITTRRGQLRRVWEAPLAGLPETDALKLIRLNARRLGLHVIAQANDDVLGPLVTVTGGNPYALETSLGYLKYGGLALDTLINALYQASREVEGIFDYIFTSAWQVMNEHARQLLMVMPFFVESATKAAIGAAAGVEGYYLEAAIGQLVEMSLLEKNDALEEAKQRYIVHPLTLAFASAKLREVPEWKEMARERWVKFYQKVATQGQDTFNYPALRAEANNLFGILSWLMAHDQMEEIESFLGNLCHFMFAEGHWVPLLQIADQVMLWAESTESLKAIRILLHPLSSILRKQYTRQKMAKWLERVQVIANRVNDPVLYAEIEMATGRYLANTEGLEMITRSLKVFKKQKQYTSIVRALNSIGIIHLRQENFEEATRCYQEGLQTLDRFKEQIDRVRDWEACLHANLILIVGRQGNYTKASKKLYQLLDHLTDQTDIAEAYTILAFYELKLGNKDQAYLLRQHADQIIERLGWVRPICTEDAEWMKLHAYDNQATT